MNWYKKAEVTYRNRKEDVVFETEDSNDMRKYGEWLRSNDGDLLPAPNKLDVKDYVYISYIWIPEKERLSGRAKQIITNFVNNANKSIFVELVNSDVTQGMVLKNIFLSLGFKIYEEGHNYIEMFKK